MKKGCAIAIAAALLIGVAVLLLSPSGQRFLALRSESTSRPGAKALRQLGCAEATVIPTRELEQTFGATLKHKDDPALLDVECAGADRSCEELARAFAHAEKLAGAFHLVVNDDEDRPVCTGYFDAQGESMGRSVVR